MSAARDQARHHLIRGRHIPATPPADPVECTGQMTIFDPATDDAQRLTSSDSTTEETT